MEVVCTGAWTENPPFQLKALPLLPNALFWHCNCSQPVVYAPIHLWCDGSTRRWQIPPDWPLMHVPWSLFSLKYSSDCDNSGDVFFWISSKMQIVCLFLDIAEIVSARAALEIKLISPLHVPVVTALIEMCRVFSQILPIIMFAFPINNSVGKS